MSRKMLVWVGAVAVVMAGTQVARAVNITIYDGVSSAATGWNGVQEDQEVEPGDSQSQAWDLEAFDLNVNTWTLSMIGGFDFMMGKDGIDPGHVFVDVDGLAPHGTLLAGSGHAPSTISNGVLGYDYVLIPRESPTGFSYALHALDETSVLNTVMFGENDESNPWTYTPEENSFLQGYDAEYLTGLGDTEVGAWFSDIAVTGGSHNLLQFDVSWLEPFITEGNEVLFHYTMECGNDNLMGRYTANRVPDGTNTGALGLGVLLLGWFGRRKLATHLN